jgi:glucose 1-dehydrogenase
MQLDGKVAIVTGAGSGIGAAIAQAFAYAGAAVCVNYYKAYEQEAHASAAGMPKGIAVSADVSDPDEVQAMMEETTSAFGRLDILVNNAGIEHTKPILDVELKEFDAVIAVNLRGAFCCLQAAGRIMRDSGTGGSIINISSIHEDLPFPGFTPYCVSKGGLRMLMRNAAVELGQHKIRVNNIAPGAIATPINTATLQDPEKVATLARIIPLGKMGTPEEVAALAVFLGSDASSYVTGSTYYVDGGMIRYAQPL